MIEVYPGATFLAARSTRTVWHFEMIAVSGGIDCRFEGNRVEFSWIGDDDGDEKNGRGWAELGKDAKLRGRLYFHRGHDSAFVAERSKG